mgnify:CR=1 FL=1
MIDADREAQPGMEAPADLELGTEFQRKPEILTIALQEQSRRETGRDIEVFRQEQFGIEPAGEEDRTVGGGGQVDQGLQPPVIVLAVFQPRQAGHVIALDGVENAGREADQRPGLIPLDTVGRPCAGAGGQDKHHERQTDRKNSRHSCETPHSLAIW